MANLGIDPARTFLACFCVASLSGLATLALSRRTLTVRACFAYWMYPGMLGLCIGLIWYHRYSDTASNSYFLIGIAGTSGLLGVSAWEFVSKVVGKGGLEIVIKPQDKDLEK